MSDQFSFRGNLNIIDGEIVQTLAYGVVHVSKSSYATNTRGSLSKYSKVRPFATIQAAINAAASGDLIWVHPGT
jgi:hypothetical protein